MKRWLRPRAGIVAAILAGACLGVMAQSLPPADLARKHSCMACHGLVHKQVGPGFAEVAARYRGDAQAPARLSAKIRSGSVGTWGRVIMPRQTQVSEADGLVLAQWILSQPAPTLPRTP